MYMYVVNTVLSLDNFVSYSRLLSNRIPLEGLVESTTEGSKRVYLVVHSSLFFEADGRATASFCSPDSEPANRRLADLAVCASS